MAEYYNNRTREVTPTPTLRDTPLNLPLKKRSGPPKGSKWFKASLLDKHREKIESMLANGVKKSYIANAVGTSPQNLSKWIKSRRIGLGPVTLAVTPTLTIEAPGPAPRTDIVESKLHASAGRKDDKDKPQLQDLFRFIPAKALGAVAEVMSHGAEKYGERNWEDDGLSIQRIQGAVLRHTHQRLRGDLIDDDSGLLHSAHAAASALMALAKDLGACELMEDDE